MLASTKKGGWQMKQYGRVRPGFQAPQGLGSATPGISDDMIKHYAQCSHVKKLRNRIKLSSSGRQHWY